LSDSEAHRSSAVILIGGFRFAQPTLRANIAFVFDKQKETAQGKPKPLWLKVHIPPKQIEQPWE
jgi:hypothetical protein